MDTLAAKARCEAATKGPWAWARGDWQSGLPPHIVQRAPDGAAAGTYLIAQVGPNGPHTPIDPCYDDARFIVAARSDLPAALEALEEVDWVRRTRPHSTLTCRLPFGEKAHAKVECDRCALDAILGESE